MILNELYDEALPGYQDVDDDNSQITVNDLRKTRLTLRQINKLRTMNDVRNYEYKQKLSKVKAQYGAAAGAEGAPEF